LTSLLPIQLLTLHVIGDFVLQPGSWVTARTQKHFRSPYLYLHGLVHTALALMVCIPAGAWWIAPVIGLGHILFDGFKSYLERSDLPAFILDQFLHIVVILGTTATFLHVDLAEEWKLLAAHASFWWYAFGYLLVIAAYPRLIAFATHQWRKDIPEEREKLVKAGRWIGIIERVLVLTFVLIGQFGAIGFLLAAKSVLRFGDLRESRDKGHTEYVLIGTLLSFGLTILTGLMIIHLN
jgi:hypothetical protein